MFYGNGPSLRSASTRCANIFDWSQAGLAAELGISQAAVSQLENAPDLSVSRLRKYLEPLGATLQILAVFDNGAEEYSIPIRVGREAV